MKRRFTRKMSNPTPDLTDLKRHSGGWWDKVAQVSAPDPDDPDVACRKNEVTGPTSIQGELHESNASSDFPVDAGGSALQRPIQGTQSKRVLCLTPSDGFNQVDATQRGDHVEKKRKPVRLEFVRSGRNADLLAGATRYE